MFFVIFFLFPCIFGYFEEYLNVIKKSSIPHRHALTHENGNYYDNLIDDTELSFIPAKRMYSAYNATLTFNLLNFQLFNLKKIRLLKTRKLTEKFNVLLEYGNNLLSKNILFEVNKGWNELLLSNKQLIKKVFISMNETTYDVLEIAELQILSTVTVFRTCHEFYRKTGDTYTANMLLYDPFSFNENNIAAIEEGSTCSSSSGNCVLAIKNNIAWNDEMWIPSSSDKNLFIKIVFFRRFLIKRISVNQPLENTVKMIKINTEGISLTMIPENDKNITEISTSTETKWIKLFFEKSDMEIFIGLYEIKAYSYKPRLSKVTCVKSGDKARISDSRPHSYFYVLSPKTKDKCSASLTYFEDNW